MNHWLAKGLLLCWLLAGSTGVPALVLEGVGHATIHNGDLERARAEARQAALRNLALQYEARVSTRDTMENGVLTQSRTELAAHARARNVQVLHEQRSGNLLRLTVRADMSAQNAACQALEASRLRKRVAITGFPVLYPEQAEVGELGDAGEVLPQQLQARLASRGQVQVLTASRLSLFGDLASAPTWQQGDNRLSNVPAVARELGAQFVVAGVIRDLGLSDPSAWQSSVWGGFKRSIGAVDQGRRFVADLMIFDGFSGAPVYQERFATEADWRATAGRSTGFGSAGLEGTAYGQAVAQVLDRMASAIDDALACQPFMTRISHVDGRAVTLASGATAGLRPGDELQVYRSARYFDRLDQTPELQDAGVTLVLNNVHPDFANGQMAVSGTMVNVQKGDLAIIW